jgi:phosphatidylinositol-3,4,5-trisphosphate 3-phosphatase/dual-specificity protein phosphatase PTEN
MEKRTQSNSFKNANRISKMAQIFEPKDNQNMFKSIVPKAGTNNININMEDGDELESDEEQDNQDIITPIKDVENYSLKDIILPKYSSEELTQEQLKKIYDLKVITENIISKTVKNRNNANIVKALVSKKKNRFCYDGFDLDLTYITERIIAMGMPSSHLEGLYRNPMEEVQRFLNTRHTAHYKVYNLCEERSYPKNSFFKQEIFPFKDHEAPPLNLMKSFCEDAKKFLDEDKKNIVAVHCKAGKGRTGTMICCLLLYMNTFETAAECLQYYGMMRAENGKGVTIPSQIRYVNYFEKIIKEKMPHPVVFIKKIITKIRMFTLPMFHKVYTPYFKIENNGMEYSSEKKKTDFKKEDLFALVDFDIEKGFLVEGDVKVTFYRDKLLKKKENIFKFWFNTNFIPNDCNIYQFKKEEIDKACKDKECKYYSPGFKIEIHFIDA